MGKKAPKVQAPAAPDPVATANAQAAANIDTARVNFANNAVNQYTPYGRLEWSQWAPDRWSAVQTLDPAEQHILNQNRALDMTMNDMGQRALWRADATLNTPFNDVGIQSAAPRINTGNLVNPYGTPQQRWSPDVQHLGVEDVRPKDTQQIADLMMKRSNPQFEAQRNAIRTNLINSGVREGSEAWNRAMDDYNRQYNDAVIGAQLAAGQEQTRQLGADLASSGHSVGQKQFNVNQQFTQGQQKAAMDFDQEMARANFQNALRGQQIQEQAFLLDRDNAERNRQLQERLMFRQVPLNEMIALAGGQQINSPNFVNSPGFNAAPGNIMDATYQTYAGQQNAYNQSIQQAMANRAGMYGLLGTGLMTAGMAFSDERLKTDIEHVGFLGSGLPVYSFRYLWSPLLMIGVMAQEAVKIFHDAVSVVNGYLAVDYSRIR